MISRSVPQMPIAWVWTRTPPSPSGGSCISPSATEPCCPGTTVMARMALTVADEVSGPSGAAGDAVQDPVKDRGALLAGRRGILGARDVERAFVEGADEDVGEGDDGLRNDRAGVHRRLQRELDQAETVAAGQIPPRLPAQDGGGVEQDDPLDVWLRAGVQEQPRADPERSRRVGRGCGCICCDPPGDLRLDLLGYGGEQVGLVA